ncbi:transcriptional regulator SplA domain-containing protein [Pallidibacillus pasinlerensis]|uniref:Uncharacterized protein n=1 Tax=Pallidibacillus pasinlerensis TaxID=2703818 RepID=A0ABX0A4S7_9BACI|nr:hypothetical protein [Pallidibacillus pasinlerensis]
MVYVVYRNPHTQNVANIQEAAVVRHPEQPDKISCLKVVLLFPTKSYI